MISTTHAHMHTQTHTRMHAHAHICMHPHMHASTHSCIHTIHTHTMLSLELIITNIHIIWRMHTHNTHDVYMYTHYTYMLINIHYAYTQACIGTMQTKTIHMMHTCIILTIHTHTCAYPQYISPSPPHTHKQC